MTRQFVPHLGWMEYPDGDDVAQFLAEGWFEYAEQAFCWLFLRPGDTVVDCGAHAGLYTRLASMATGPNGRVIAVEPTAAMADLTEQNVPEGAAAAVVRAAVGAARGVARMAAVESGRSAYASVMPTGADSPSEAATLEVDCITLDELAEREGLERIAFLKLDIEGAESAALRGAAGLIAAGRVDVLMVEFDEKILAEIGSSTAELAGQLTDMGLGLYRFDPERVAIAPLELDGPLWYDNVLALRDASLIADRLRDADDDRRSIARDIIARGAFAAKLRASADRAGQLEAERRDGQGYIARLEAHLSEANADREALRGAVTEIDAERNRARAEAAKLGNEIASLSAEVGRSRGEAEEAKQQLALTTDALEASRREAELVRTRLDHATASLAQVADAADRFGGALSRVCRVPLGKALVRLVSPDRAPWVADLPGEVGRARRAASAAMGAGERAEDDEPIVPDAAQPLLSVIICTHNPRRDLLDWTLDSLRRQTIDPACYELIVVDNNSDPALDAAALDPDGTLGLKVVRESRPGLTFARIGGLNASRAEVLVYVDDDNALAEDYLERAVRIARANPEIGSFGGKAEGVLETEPPEWIRDLIPHLGVRDHGDEVITSKNEHWGEWDPIGAGMVVRRAVAERYAKVVESTATAGGLGRQGKLQLSGEDTLMNRCANLEGFACSYQPSLRLRHFMKAERLTGRNIRRTIEGHGRSFVVLERTLGREVAPIEGLKRWRWLIQRALFRAPSGLSKGYALWRWDVGYARASAAVSGPQHGVSAGVVDSPGEER